MPHLHIIGICGTAMAGLAALAKERGWVVTGSDHGVYPPMSLFLRDLGIPLQEGFRAENLHPVPDMVLVGNAISRGNPELEEAMNRGIPFRSGGQWLFENVLEGRHPVVVTGTHGKTTTTSMIARLMDEAGLRPGFFIGGIPRDFGVGARFPQSQWVVIEGDEYDTAFFDKRPKFLHYHPKTLILHNLEFDHGDIYPDLEAIRVQFRLLLRLVPANGQVMANWDDPEIRSLAERAHAPVVTYGLNRDDVAYTARLNRADGQHWSLFHNQREIFQVHWELLGRHNVLNGLAAAATCLHHQVDPAMIKQGLERFQGVARRLQERFNVEDIRIYDDFAHHPTAMATTIDGLKCKVGSNRVWVVIEPRSNTMRSRAHQERLAPALAQADFVVLARPAPRGMAPDKLLDVDAVAHHLNQGHSGPEPRACVVANGLEAAEYLTNHLKKGDHCIIMSNGGFDGIHERLHHRLTEVYS
ncbi:MAG: UDP-N-acetylmuramate:L-alanyl-gamma-D-glutamyl-meso-diaminopimelate ligase [Magnetococcales bacterium]|nr:UDP-N-acetylmuramate:L-alanyl-gamma-D-glutamyl-meso-diaminopimelate ligase [Magnetococcales bacterium]MBF0346848.1 UDP-N-acetylmuramate:L-alanyl-gamma-D-glutamyl-meso-diaminopimelate ligase [Magnetococcales bacterium]